MAQRCILTLGFAILISFSISTAPVNTMAQALNAGTVSGVVTDPNGAVVPNASITIFNSITGYKRSASTDADGSFRFADVPPNNYQLTASGTGFATATQTLTVRTSVPINLKIALTISTASETVTVTGNAADVIENV